MKSRLTGLLNRDISATIKYVSYGNHLEWFRRHKTHMLGLTQCLFGQAMQDNYVQPWVVEIIERAAKELGIVDKDGQPTIGKQQVMIEYRRLLDNVSLNPYDLRGLEELVKFYQINKGYLI